MLPALIFVIVSAAVLSGGFYLCRWNNDFPLGYQPDEPSKAEQLLEDQRNYRHPLLMLNVTDCVTRWEQTPRDPESIVHVGRDCSALLAAGGGLLIAWAGMVVGGWTGFALLGLAGAMCPAVVANAHYFKEEAALCFGVGFVVFGAAVMSRAKHPLALLGATALLGIACGTAASGKYPGAIFLAPSLVLVIGQCGRRWIVSPAAIVLLIAFTVATWAGINQRAIREWDDFKSGFVGEEEHVTSDGHFGLTMDQPNGFFIDAVWNEAMPHVAVLTVAAPFVLLLQRRRVRFGIWLLGTAGVYLACLSYSVVPFFRYAVPVTLLLHVTAALTVVLLARMAIGRPMLRGVVIGVGAGVIGFAQLQRCIDYDTQFESDSRVALLHWVAANVPPGAAVVEDDYANLHNNRSAISARVIHRSMWAADIGDVDSLRRRGVAYVVTAGSNSDRFFSPYDHGTATGSYNDESFARRLRFYETLRRDCPVVWQTRAANPMQTFANPDLTVYRLFPLHDTKR